jgi:acyl dehydratase
VAALPDDYNPIHYDKDMRAHGLPVSSFTGNWPPVFLAQMITDWIGGRKLRESRKLPGMNLPCGTITCSVTVTNKLSRKKNTMVSLKIWSENEKGKKPLRNVRVVRPQELIQFRYF